MSTLTTLATATQESLSSQTVRELRQLATGQISGYSSMKKAELVNALLAEGDRLRAFAESLDEKQAAKDLEQVSIGLGEYAPKFFRRFKGIVEANLDLSTGETKQTIYPDISGLCAALVSYLNGLEGRDGRIVDSTKLRYKSEIMNALKANVQTEQGSFLKPAMESAISILERALAQALKEQYTARKTNYKQGLAARKDSKTDIDVKPLLALAENVLINVETLKVRDWTLVSVAIAIATGRRMAEVHGADTKFESSGDDSLMFTGQLKAKGAAADYYDENPSYEIPCLVYPALVVAGHQWLRDNGKLENDPKKAHNRFSRYLSEQVKKVFFEANVGGDRKKQTYKALRAIYGQVAFAQSGANDEAAYLAQILGHGRQDLAAGGTSRIADFMTPQSYNSDWKVTA